HVFGRDSRTASPKVGFRLVSIGIGTLDDPDLVRPQLLEGWGNRVAWFAEPAALPRFEGGTLPHPSKRVPGEPYPRVQPDPPARAFYLANVGGGGPVNLVTLGCNFRRRRVEDHALLPGSAVSS